MLKDRSTAELPNFLSLYIIEDVSYHNNLMNKDNIVQWYIC